MEMQAGRIKERVEAVKKSVRESSNTSGRDPSSIIILAALKTRSAEECASLIRSGIDTVGENRVQEGLDHLQKLSEETLPAFESHFIGRLQSNKVRKAVRAFDSIDSIDGESLASRVARIALEEHRKMDVMIEVNLGEEDQKGGVPFQGVEKLAEQIYKLEGLCLTGLMGIPPYFEDPELSRPFFRKLAGLFERVRANHPDPDRFRWLSMGMSNDYVVAIQEGATMVRIGTALFGPRRYK
jgi:PLP dependent protein